MNLDSLIGVFGSSRPSEENRELASRLGRQLGEEGYAIITGGSTGISEAAAEGILEQGGEVLCILPNRKLAASSETITVPKGAQTLHMAEGGFKTRNMITVENSEVAVFIEGAWGTLNELTLAADFGKRVVVLHTSGGISSMAIDLSPFAEDTSQFATVPDVDEAIASMRPLLQ